MRFIGVVLVLLAGVLAPAASQQTDQKPKEQRRTGLVRESLAGQPVPVMPITHLVRDTTLADSNLRLPRPKLLAWADSIFTEALVERAPEISWLYGAELERVVRRAAGRLPTPARFGHSVLRASRLKTVPDPTRSRFRTLTALADGRFVFVPASLAFTRDSTGQVRAVLTAVVTDTRTGAIGWRAGAIGIGPTAEAALRATIDYFLPEETVTP